MVRTSALCLILAACLFTGKAQADEGYSSTPYLDSGKVLTVCFGHTGKEVKRGQDWFLSDCLELLWADINNSYDVVMKCSKVTLTQEQLIVLVDAVYNIGPKVICGSTLQSELNHGKPAKIWCSQLLRWNKDHYGHVLTGLDKRRRIEYELCIRDSTDFHAVKYVGQYFGSDYQQRKRDS